MQRRQITAAVIMGVDRLLAQGLDHPTIAKRLGITEYVIGVVNGDEAGKGRRQPPDLYKSWARNRSLGIDAATIRMIQRMLQVGILSTGQIAREVGVSLNLVEDVAANKRLPLSAERPIVLKDLGEQFLEQPIRCPHCHASISIVPCRACRARVS